MFLKKIIEGLKEGSLSILQAKEKAQQFLKLQPFTTTEDAKEKLRTLRLNTHSLTALWSWLTHFIQSKKQMKRLKR